MVGKVAFLMKDVVLLAVSIYLSGSTAELSKGDRRRLQ